MSSIVDAGYYADIASKEKENKCEKSPNSKHKWIIYSKGCPSQWEECKYCGKTIFWK